jgi:predicted Rossmann-fold nucleotide-binding protein
MGILNVAGYFDPLLALLDHAVAEGFLRPKHLNLLITSDDPDALIEAMRERMPAEGGRQRIDFESNP